jgi:ferritin-like metal-binding protein YciE
MDTSEQKVVQYLNEAHASEVALVRVLQSQIAMTPRGAYRTALEKHLRETQDHATQVTRRLSALEAGSNPLMAAVGLAETIVGQVLALSKTPLDLLRGTGGEEKILKNAKDAAATEALEIATYTALEQVARRVGDDETVALAASIRADEERMLQTILTEIPKLTDAVVRAEVKGNPSFDVTKTGAADAARDVAASAKDVVTKTAAQSRRTARSARATAQSAGGAKAPASEPWAGYDALTVAEVRAVLAEGEDERAAQVRAYERAHKNRAGVVSAAERARTTA